MFCETFIPVQYPVVFCTIDIRFIVEFVTHKLGIDPVKDAVLKVDGYMLNVFVFIHGPTLTT